MVGTPYKDQATILDLAVALYGLEGVTTVPYQRNYRQHGCFVAANMGYADPRPEALERFVVSADLEQAIGRLRPLQNPGTIYVLSNAPVHGWEVDQVLASELFDLRKPLRRDAAANYDRYADEVLRQLDSGSWVGNPEVCAMLGLKERIGRNYMKRFRGEYGDRLEAHGSRIA